VFKGWIDESENCEETPTTSIPVAVKTLNPDGLQGHKQWLVCNRSNPKYISL